MPDAAGSALVVAASRRRVAASEPADVTRSFENDAWPIPTPRSKWAASASAVAAHGSGAKVR